jgi:hypothetical protein
MAQNSWGELRILEHNLSSQNDSKSKPGSSNEPKKEDSQSKTKKHKRSRKKTNTKNGREKIDSQAIDKDTVELTEEDNVDKKGDKNGDKKGEKKGEEKGIEKKDKKGADQGVKKGKSHKTKTGSKQEVKKNKKKKKPRSKAERDEWKLQVKNFKRTKGRVRAIGVILLILIIFASILGYVYFFQIDTDGDGIPDASDSDDDNDDIPDSWEEKYGLNPRDSNDATSDKDGDGLNNRNEYNFQSDPTVIDTDDDDLTDFDEWRTVKETYGKSSNPNNPDTDRDGMPDGWEWSFDLNPIDNDADLDTDSDGYDANQNGILEQNEYYTNHDEYINNTDPKYHDSDYDGMWDGWEIYYLNECLKLRLRFSNYNPPGNTDYNFSLNPLDPSDAIEDIDVESRNNVLYIKPDGLTNVEEFKNRSNPTKPDTDGDNLTDYEELEVYNTNPLYWDSDFDGLWDGWEVKYGGADAGLDPSSNDTDSDGTPDGQEDLDLDGKENRLEQLPSIGTSPVLWDTDGDRMPDGWEIDNGRNPRMIDAEFDSDFDLLINIAEYENGTLPDNPDTDSDGLLDGDELVTGFAGVLVNGVYKTTIAGKYRTDPTNNDTDSDGLLDGEEVVKGGDGYITNATNSDSDGDGLDDVAELTIGVDGFITNPTNEDTDNDRLTDREEIDNVYGYNTLPTKGDTDGDGLKDGDEVLTDFLPFKAGLDNTDPTKLDTDGDGMDDGWEWEFGYAERNDTIIKNYDLRFGTNYIVQLQNNMSILGLWLVNPLKIDGDEDPDYDGYDGDGNKRIDKDNEFTNFKEYGNYTNPLWWDTDHDQMSDGWETFRGKNYKGPDPLIDDANVDLENDGEGDGIDYIINNQTFHDDFTNLEEFLTGIDLNNDGIIDHDTTSPNQRNSDQLGLDDYEEIWFADSDGDGLFDGWELIFNGSTPWDPEGFVPYEIMPGKFNPYNNDSDGNGLTDGKEDYDNDSEVNQIEMAYPGSRPGSSDPTNESITQATLPYIRSIRKSNKEENVKKTNYKTKSKIINGNIHPQNIYQNYLITYFYNNIKLNREFRINCVQQSSSIIDLCVCSGDTRIWR